LLLAKAVEDEEDRNWRRCDMSPNSLSSGVKAGRMRRSLTLTTLNSSQVGNWLRTLYRFVGRCPLSSRGRWAGMGTFYNWTFKCDIDQQDKHVNTCMHIINAVFHPQGLLLGKWMTLEEKMEIAAGGSPLKDFTSGSTEFVNDQGKQQVSLIC
jgi:hypothetical protein